MSLGELYDDLTDHMTTVTEAGPPTGDGVFVVDSLEKADWAVRKVAQARRHLAEAADLANSERARIDEWLADQTARCEQKTAFFEELLARYHRDLLVDDPKAKTVRLPSGDLVARKQPDSLVVDGGDDTIEWVGIRFPDAVVVKRTVDKNALKRKLVAGENDRVEGTEAVDPETGQVVPGVWFKVGEVSFKVTTDGDR